MTDGVSDVHRENAGPLAADGRARRLAPFAVVGALAFVAAGVMAPGGDDAESFAAAAGVGLLVAASVSLVPWRRLPLAAQALPPLGFYVVIALLREAAGGAHSPFGPLVMLPITWFALHGTRRQVHVAIAATALTLAIPIVAVGEPGYPASEWVRVLLSTAVGALIGTTVHRLVGTGRDRELELGKTVDALGAVTARFDRAITDAPIGIAVLDPTGVYERVNAAFCEILARPADQIVGRTFQEFTEPADATLGEDRTRAALAGEISSFALEKRYVRPDGELRTAMLAAALVRDPDGEPAHFFCWVRDVTERRRSEQLTRDQAENLKVAMEIAHEIAAGTDTRELICAAAKRALSADFVEIAEPDGTGRLRATAIAGRDKPITDVALSGERSGAATAFMTQQRLVVEDAPNDPLISQRLVTLSGVRGVYFEPVVHNGSATAVLIVGWAEMISAEERGRAGTMLGLLGAEAAIALERADMVRRLDDAALTDALTGIPNRRAWDERLAAEIAAARRSGEPFSVLMLDLDHFKAFNDLHGHQAGDRLLKEAAAAWQATLRAGDFLARYGGEEFALLIPGGDLTKIRAIFDRIRENMPAGETVSGGIGVWTSDPEVDVLAEADRALYEAKRAGRNTCTTAGTR